MGDRLKLLFLFLCSISGGRCDYEASNSDVAPKIDAIYIPYAELGKTVISSEEELGFSVMSASEVMKNKEVVHMQFTSTKYSMVDSNEEAAQLMDISGSLQLQLNLGALVGSAYGAGGYFHENRDRSDHAELVFVTKVVKKFEVLKNLDFSVTQAQCDLAKRQNSTHVITGITYGAQCVISCQIKTSATKSKDTINAEVTAQLGLGKVSEKC